jgi:cyclase
MRILRPADGVLAFYDGRVEGYRFAEELNWIDDGALGLGIASYAIVDGDEALVYDTHVTVEHARFVREALEAGGVTRFVVVLSHKHLDHIAGTEAFADCEVVATRLTAEALAAQKDAIEAGTLAGPPGIDPLVLPTRTFEERTTLGVGRRHVELIHVDIHSDDAAVLWLPAERILFAGDTLEDTVTYVSEPDGHDHHLAGLEELAALDPDRILPNHGDRTSSLPAATPRASSTPRATTSTPCGAAPSSPSCARRRCESWSPTRCGPAGSRTSSPTKRSTARTSGR